jgi:hypothetical protein
MFDLDAEVNMVFRVLYEKEAILLLKTTDSDGTKIFLNVAGVKVRAERYNRR